MKKITDFPLKSTFNDEDLLLIWDAESASTLKVQLADLKTYFSGTGSQQPKTINLNYIANGDSNGVFYYYGTNGKTTAWSNPKDKIVFSASSVFSDRAPDRLADRLNKTLTNDAHTDQETNAWFKASLPNKLIVNHYTLQARNTTDQQPRSWVLEASNDDVNFTIIDAQSSNSTLSNGSFYSKAITEQTTGYHHWRWRQTGNNSSSATYFVLGEAELYGSLII